jgi:1-acyl-sn-glycerol-3-phosphate acyltransferase
MEPVYTPVIAFARAVFALQGLRITVTGAENVPVTGGAVMTINHTGYLDFALAGVAARPAGRLVRFMAKEQVFRHPVSGPLMRGMHHIPVDRTAGAASYRAAVQALRAGEIVGVFPEATISRSFELKGFKTGAVRMAAAAGVPLLPTVIWGSQRIWTKGHPKRLGRTRTPVTISVGSPILVGRKDDAEEVLQSLRAAMTELLHAAQDAYPPLTGDDLKFLPARLGGTAPTLEQAEELDASARADAEAGATERGSQGPGTGSQ